MSSNVDGEVVLEGVWLYGGTTECRIAIIRRDVRYGSADYEDPPEVAQDLEAETFEVLYTAAGDPDRFAAGGGQFQSLETAREAVESACGASVRWQARVSRT
jgi:hypothetical protein